MNPNEPTPNSNPNTENTGVPPTPPAESAPEPPTPFAPESSTPVTPNIVSTPDETPTPITTAPLTPGGEPPKALVSDNPAPKSITLNNGAKKPKTGLILTIILIVIILIGGGYFAYNWWQNNQTSNDTKKSPNADTTTTSADLSQLSDALKAKLQGTSPSISKTSSAQVGPSYQATDADFYTNPSLGSDVLGVTYGGDASTANANLATITSVLGDENFTKTAGSIDTSSTDPTYSVELYSSKDVACSLSYDTSTVETPTDFAVALDLECSNVADYADNVSTIKPLATAYLDFLAKGTTETAGAPSIGTPTISDSKTADYKTAEATISSPLAATGGASGLFYQTPDGTWHFFKAAQSETNCSDYNTDDLKKAYLGNTCYDSVNTTESTVQL